MLSRLKKIDIHIYIAIVMFWLLVGGFFVQHSPYEVMWRETLFVFIVLGSLPLLFEIVSSFRKGVFGVDVIAVAAILAALFTGELVAAGIVVLMLSTGEALERFAETRARASLERLLRRAPSKASLKKHGSIVVIPISQVVVGDVLVIKKGEVIPVDGVVLEGMSLVDESVVNGEPLPRDVKDGVRVVSGTTNIGDMFTMKATATYEKSMFSGIVRLVQKAEQEKAPTVRMANRYSIYFTLFTFVAAALAFLKDPKLATAVLVVATPCPLILAAPIAFVSGMSRSAKRGIIVKHGGVFELITKAKAYFFDKTGTLTLGIPQVERVSVIQKNLSEKDIVKYALTLEQGSSHVFAQGVIAHAHKHHVRPEEGKKIKEVIGQGVEGTIGGKKYYFGRLSFLVDRGVIIGNEREAERSTIYLAEEKKLLGSISFSDTIRKNAKQALTELGDIQPHTAFVLITGDDKEHAKEIGKSLGFSKIESNCLPEDKLTLIKKYEKNGGGVVMVGDGVNDAPSLAGASVGVALGSHGATVATDIADAVITVDNIERIVELAEISKKTLRVAKESMFIGMGLSVLAMGAAYMGHLPPIQGAILQEGIDVLVILNALRAL
jgi:heavy metal translocating P-type ATPase